MMRNIPVDKITCFSDPVNNPPWHCLDRPVEEAGVLDAYRRGVFQDHHFVPLVDRANMLASQHEHRIAWMMHNPQDDPISIYVGEGSEMYPGWIVADGNHRLYAAILLGNENIPCDVSGSCDIIERLFPEPSLPQP